MVASQSSEIAVSVSSLARLTTSATMFGHLLFCEPEFHPASRAWQGNLSPLGDLICSDDEWSSPLHQQIDILLIGFSFLFDLLPTNEKTKS